jgi:exosome complex component RRP4
MVKLIKGATGCEITVGQNGKVWISGKSVEKEIATGKIIQFIVENSTIVGLTEKVENYVKDLGFSPRDDSGEPTVSSSEGVDGDANEGVEVVEEDTDEGDVEEKSEEEN